MAAAHLAFHFHRGFDLLQTVRHGFVVVIGLTAAVAPVVMGFPGLPGTPGQIHPGIGTDGAALHVGNQRGHAEAHGGGYAGRLGKPPVIMDCAVQGHNAAHAGAADGGAFPEGHGPVFPVDHGLDLLNDPAEGGIALGIELAEIARGGIGKVFAEPLLAVVAAFHAHYDHVLVPALQEFLQAPGFSVGGIGIQKQVVAVKKVHDGVALVGLMIIILQPDVQRPVLALGRVDKVPLDDHKNTPEL